MSQKDKPSGEQIDRDRFFNMAEAYDSMCRHMVPGYGFLQETLLRMLEFRGVSDPTILDLGAGSGILLEKLLRRYPRSIGYWLDFSEDFHQLARRKLEPYADRLTFIKAEFKDGWESQLRHAPDIIVSMSAIHHLEDEDKAALYKRCRHVLADGGWFFNIDEMKTIHEESYIDSLRYWVWHVQRAGGELLTDLSLPYERWLEKFEGWKKRNLENIHKPKSEGDDLHASFLRQLDMLTEAGFSGVDVFAKLHLWCMIGGRKDADG
jgi:SAM-dependent methyltransferase